MLIGNMLRGVANHKPEGETHRQDMNMTDKIKKGKDIKENEERKSKKAGEDRK